MMKRSFNKYFEITLIVFLLSTSSVQAGEIPRSASPENARVYIISPADGETVNEILTVKYGLQEMGVAPAGVDKKHTGHHHLLIDSKELPAFNKPMGNEVKHFGGGQTEATIQLTKGKHTLQLILGDHMHVPHDPPVVSEKITVYVQ